MNKVPLRRGLPAGTAAWLPLVCAAAVFRVWVSYAGRIGGVLDAVRFFGIPAAAAGWFLFERRGFDREAETGLPAFLAAVTALALYGVSLFTLPNLAQGMIGLAALGFAFAAAYPAPESPKRFAYAAVLPFALPLEPTLRFVTGYPLRKLTGAVTAALLSPLGVKLHGTVLTGPAGTGVCVDAPCSGVTGVTLFLFAGAVVSLVRRETVPGTALVLLESFVCALFYNVFRASWLFMADFMGNRPGFGNAEVTAGVVSFALSLGLFAGLYLLTLRARQRRRA